MSPKLTDKHLTFVGIDKVLNVEFLLHFAKKKKDKETYQCFQLCVDTFTKKLPFEFDSIMCRYHELISCPIYFSALLKKAVRIFRNES